MIERIKIETREQWLGLRRQDVTASDVASLCGEGRRSALAIYAEKMGLVSSAAENDAMRRGRWCEPAVFEALREERPAWTVRRAGEYLRDPAARLGCTPDGFAADPERETLGIVQCKVVSRPVFRRDWLNNPDAGEDDKFAPVCAPISYQLQTITEMMLAEAGWGVLAALVLDTFSAFLRIIPVERHDGAERTIRQRVMSFWADVDAGRQPAVDPTHDAETIKSLFPRDDGTEIDLSGDNELPGMVNQLATLKADLKEAETQKSEIETLIKSKLGPHSYGRLADGRVISWRLQQRGGYTVKPTEYRVLKISGGKN